MHPEARQFLDYVRAKYGPAHYKGRVLDVGSCDINGNNRHYFPGCEYTGCDVVAGNNVDVVSPCHLLPFEDGSFDVVVSSECLEHDMHYAKTLRKIERMLKPGGIFVMTCASTGRAEHGTRRTLPGDSLTTQLDDATWGDYYKNLTEADVRAELDAAAWRHTEFHYNPHSHDLYFVGIRA